MSFQSMQYSAAQKALERRNYREALEILFRVMKKDPGKPLALESARKAARIAQFEIKDYLKAIECYRYIVLYSPNASERISAQKSIGNLYFEKLLDYAQAIIEINRFLPLLPSKERSPYRLLLAKAESNLNNFDQALIEIEGIIKENPSQEVLFETLLFKGHILQSEKKLEGAISVFNLLIKKYPHRAKKENVGLSLAICLEEKGEFSKAINILETIKNFYPTPDFVQTRINRLKDRMENLPGAQGFKR
ncbi:MAG: hypothetical protein K1X29_01090 [Bdellovibrionales bacterium]|nr:hypothetical protein [Bdellovibrionales bacterium]